MSEEKLYCSKCKQMKPVSEFGINRTKKSGRQSYCKECSAKASKEIAIRKKNGEVLKLGRPSVFTPETIEEIKEYRKAGFTYSEISKIVNIKESTIRTYFCQNHITTKNETGKDTTPVHEDKPVINSTVSVMPPKADTSSKPTLKDFQARDMIKYLYNLGYRIEDNKLVCYVKQTVNVKDIINA